jgi:hypothetical protein
VRSKYTASARNRQTHTTTTEIKKNAIVQGNREMLQGLLSTSLEHLNT